MSEMFECRIETKRKKGQSERKSERAREDKREDREKGGKVTESGRKDRWSE